MFVKIDSHPGHLEVKLLQIGPLDLFFCNLEDSLLLLQEASSVQKTNKQKKKNPNGIGGSVLSITLRISGGQ